MGIQEDKADLYSEKPAPTTKFTETVTRAYASAESPEIAPEGTVFVPQLGTYVDADVAEQVLGEGDIDQIEETANYTEALDPRDYEDSPNRYGQDDQNPGEEQRQSRDQGDKADDFDEGPSETFEEVADMVGGDAVEAVSDKLIGGDFDGAIDELSGTLGVDAGAAVTVVEMAVEESRPTIEDAIGSDAFNSLLYAATATDDQMAREVLADVVQGVIPASRIADAYQAWFESLPDF